MHQDLGPNDRALERHLLRADLDSPRHHGSLSMVGSRRARFLFARPDQSSPPRPPVSTSGWVCVYGGEKGTTPAKSGISGLLRTGQSIEGYVYMAVKKGPPWPSSPYCRLHVDGLDVATGKTAPPPLLHNFGAMSDPGGGQTTAARIHARDLLRHTDTPRPEESREPNLLHPAWPHRDTLVLRQLI